MLSRIHIFVNTSSDHDRDIDPALVINIYHPLGSIENRLVNSLQFETISLK